MRYDTFAEEFSSILQRQAHLDDPVNVTPSETAAAR